MRWKLTALTLALSVGALAPAFGADPEAEPESEAKPSADGKKKGKSAGVLAANLRDTPVGDRAWYIAATMQLRMLTVTDETPRADRTLLWGVQGGYRLLPGLNGFARAGLQQRFVAEEGESGFRFQDLELGATYQHDVDLVKWVGRKLTLFHRASVFLPTSRVSNAQDLYLAPQAISNARINLVKNLYFGLTGLFQYRFHKYAERAGLGDPIMNTQLALGAQAALEYSVPIPEWAGSLTLGIDGFMTTAKAYRSLGTQPSDNASDTMWRPGYGWDLYAQYVPLPYLVVGVSLEQGGFVLRNGIVNTFLFHRDETELAFTLTGRY